MRLRFVGIASLVASLWCGRALALDPSRTLTQYAHRTWQAQQGLPQGTIYSIWQTHDSYLWLGTQTGLVRFDGVRFTTIENLHRNAPVNVWIRSLVEDAQHTLWIATNEAGLYRIENEAVTHFSIEDGMPSATVACVLAARNGDVWACTAKGVAQISGGKLSVYSTQQGLASNNVRAACQADDGTLWVGGDSPDVSAYKNGGVFVSHHLTSLPADAAVRSMRCSGRDVWIGTTAGLVQFTEGREHLFTVKDGLADSHINSLFESREGTLWIGTRNGFSRMRKGEIDSFSPQEGLSQSTVYSMLEDREGSLWVGTKNGLNQFLDGRAIPYTVNEGLPSNDTGPVMSDHRGITWVGTLGGGLSSFDGRHFTVLTTKQGLVSNSIYALAEDANHMLWVGTGVGLNRLRNGRVEATYTTVQGLPANSIQCLFRDRAGNLWVGTSAGPAMFSKGTFREPPGISRALHVRINAIGEDRDGRLYFAAGDAGVYVYSNGLFEEFLQNGAAIRDVGSFYLDPDGLLWMGGIGTGLRLLDHGRLTAFFVRDGLFDNEVYGIVRDDQDRLWMACSKGLSSVRRSDLRKYAAGEIKKFVSTPYSPTDALRTIECKPGVQPAAWKTPDGRLWFSTIRGLIVFDPKHLLRNIPPPPVVIEEVTVNGKGEEPAEIDWMPPGQKNLEFRYTGLSLIQPARITFRYILDGYDKDWINAGTRREAFYTNLPPGKFRFRVTACNADGVCNEAGSAVAFGLASHYYQRPWFFPACAVALGLTAWLVYQLRIRRLRDHFSLILTERSRIARELHDTLIQGLSGITMEMQALAARMRSPAERGTLEDIILDAGTCLRETRQSVAGLRSARDPNSGLATAIADAARQITETKNVRLKLKIEKGPEGLSPEVEYNLLRIASEAVNNSVKHSGARVIEVALKCTPLAVCLSVKDDGAGFAREENGNVRPGHYGLIGMRERATQIGAELILSSEPGRGTTVSVLLPAGQPEGVHS